MKGREHHRAVRVLCVELSNRKRALAEGAVHASKRRSGDADKRQIAPASSHGFVQALKLLAQPFARAFDGELRAPGIGRELTPHRQPRHELGESAGGNAGLASSEVRGGQAPGRELHRMDHLQVLVADIEPAEQCIAGGGPHSQARGHSEEHKEQAYGTLFPYRWSDHARAYSRRREKRLCIVEKVAVAGEYAPAPLEGAYVQDDISGLRLGVRVAQVRNATARAPSGVRVLGLAVAIVGNELLRVLNELRVRAVIRRESQRNGTRSRAKALHPLEPESAPKSVHGLVVVCHREELGASAQMMFDPLQLQRVDILRFVDQ